MTKAVAAGVPKLRIEESAARRQALIDRGEEIIVGVNKYQPETQDNVDILDIDNTAVRDAQIERLEAVRRSRDEAACQKSLEALSEAARSGEGNLLALSIEAARARASGGEISDALEKIYTRHKAEIRSISGVYGSAYEGDEGFEKIKQEVDAFAEAEGRRPRMIVVKLGQDGHDRGAKIIATAFADIGFDVDIGPLENDVHEVGISSQAAGHKTLVPALIAELRRLSAEDIIVVCGGVIPPQDYEQLKQEGVAAIYGPGTNIPDAAIEIMSMVAGSRKAAAE